MVSFLLEGGHFIWEENMKSIQCILTPEQGKKLIARAVLCRADVQEAAREHTLVVVAGSTNAPIAQALLEERGLPLDPSCFLRGAIRPADRKPGQLMGDVIIRKGEYLPGKTILDIADELGRGDVILKGANAVYLPAKEAAVLIGSPVLGTAGAVMPAVVGRHAKLLVPVGVEKRIDLPVHEASRLMNAPDHSGTGLLPLPGEVITELDAFETLCGVTARLTAAGGIWGCEGAAVFVLRGEADTLERSRALLERI